MNTRRKKIIKTEIFRKSIHFCTAFVPLLLNIWFYPIIALLIVTLCAYIICERLRQKGHKVLFISYITEKAARNRDEHVFILGPVTLCVGVILTALFFKPLPAQIGIWSLAFGDGFASLIGKLVGHTEIPHTRGKTIAGSLACFVASFLVCFFASKQTLFSICIAFCAMVIELIPLKDYDNLVIPVVIAAVSQFYFHM